MTGVTTIMVMGQAAGLLPTISSVTVYMFLMVLINWLHPRHDSLDTFLAVLFFVLHVRSNRRTARAHRAMGQHLQSAYARIDQLETEQLAIDSEIEQLAVERNRSFLKARRAEQVSTSVSEDLEEARERNEHLERVLEKVRGEYARTAQALEVSKAECSYLKEELVEERQFLDVVAKELRTEIEAARDVEELLDAENEELRIERWAAEVAQETLEVENEELAGRLQDAQQTIWDFNLRADLAQSRMDVELEGKQMRSSLCFEMLPWYLCEVREDDGLYGGWRPDAVGNFASAPE